MVWTEAKLYLTLPMHRCVIQFKCPAVCNTNADKLAHVFVFRRTTTRPSSTTIRPLSLRRLLSYCPSLAWDRCMYIVETRRMLHSALKRSWRPIPTIMKPWKSLDHFTPHQMTRRRETLLKYEYIYILKTAFRKVFLSDYKAPVFFTQEHLKKVTVQYSDDVEAWIELAQILEQTDIQVKMLFLHMPLSSLMQHTPLSNCESPVFFAGCSFCIWHGHSYPAREGPSWCSSWDPQ